MPPGLPGGAPVLGTERAPPGALLCLHTPARLLVAAYRGPRGRPGGSRGPTDFIKFLVAQQLYIPIRYFFFFLVCENLIKTEQTKFDKTNQTNQAKNDQT